MAEQKGGNYSCCSICHICNPPVIEGYTELQLEEALKTIIVSKKITMGQLLREFKLQLKNAEFKMMFTRVVKRNVRSVTEDGLTYILKWGRRDYFYP